MNDGARFALTVSLRDTDPQPLPLVTAGFEGSHGQAISVLSTKDETAGGAPSVNFFEAGTDTYKYDVSKWTLLVNSGGGSIADYAGGLGLDIIANGSVMGYVRTDIVGTPDTAEVHSATTNPAGAARAVGMMHNTNADLVYINFSLSGVMNINLTFYTSGVYYQIPLAVSDASGDVVAKLDFDDAGYSYDITVGAENFTGPVPFSYFSKIAGWGPYHAARYGTERYDYVGMQGAGFPYNVGETNYWTDTWGGTIDTPSADSAWVIGNRYLAQVGSLATLAAVPWTFYVDELLDLVWMNTGPYFWAYDAPKGANREESLLRVSTSVDDPQNPMDDRIDGVPYPTRLSIPSTPLDMSTPTHGVSLSDVTSFTFLNNDGKYDDQLDKMLHSRVELRKRYGGAWRTIYTGEVDDATNDFDSIKLKCTQKYGGFTQSAVNTIGEALGDLLDLYDLEDGVASENCPRVYGAARFYEPVKLGTTNGGLTVAYVFQDPKALVGNIVYKGVYYSETPATTPTAAFPSKGVITFTWPTVEDVVEPDAISCNTYDSIGLRLYTGVTAIRDILLDRGQIPIDDATWDLVELDDTIDKALTDTIGAVLDDGTLRGAVDTFTPTGMYHFLEKPDGRFTVRIFGETYETHVLREWAHTEDPIVGYWDKSLLTTSARVAYASKDTGSTPATVKRWALYDSEEALLTTEGGRAHRVEVDADIYGEAVASALAGNLVRFFGERLKVVETSWGEDLSGVTQLDTIQTTILINGRLLVDGASFLVASINRSQDTATLIYTAGYEPQVTDIFETGSTENDIVETGSADSDILETGRVGL